MALGMLLFIELPQEGFFSATGLPPMMFSEIAGFRHTRFLEVQALSRPSSFAREGWTLSFHGLFLLGDY